jgi:hypothetical protein
MGGGYAVKSVAGTLSAVSPGSVEASAEKAVIALAKTKKQCKWSRSHWLNRKSAKLEIFTQ